MVITELDRPEDFDGKCEICGGPMRVVHFRGFTRWLPRRAHDVCIDNRNAPKNKAVKPQTVPEKFSSFDIEQADKESLKLATGFLAQTKRRVLAIIGNPGHGKSRLLWMTVKEFFDERGNGEWVEAFDFEALVAELDKEALGRLTQAKYALVDDIGSVASYGRERAGLQAVLRARIKANRFTFVSIDNLEFDPGLESLLKSSTYMVAV